MDEDQRIVNKLNQRVDKINELVREAAALRIRVEFDTTEITRIDDPVPVRILEIDTSKLMLPEPMDGSTGDDDET